MILNRKFIIFVVFLLSFEVFSQDLRVGFESNAQYYTEDNKIKLSVLEKKHRFRSNSYLKVDYSHKNFSFGLQGEGYWQKTLLNFNPNLKNYHLGSIYTRYKHKQLFDVTLGHIYEQFGSGLALRFWEDRALGINNSLFGGRFKLNFEPLNIKLLAGKQRIGMGFDFSKGFIYGADIQTDISKLTQSDFSLKLGFSISSRNEEFSKEIKHNLNSTHILGGRLDYEGEKFNINTEYLYKTKDIHYELESFNKDAIRAGNALLINMGYNEMGLAINLNLRRLENFSFASQRNLVNNVYNYAMLNYIPALTKQYEHSLQNIYVYQAQPKLIYEDFLKKQGEIGGQFDVFFQAEEGSFLGGKTGADFALNGSVWSGLKNHQSSYIYYDKYGTEFEKTLLETDFFAFGDKFYHDISLEYRKYFSEKWNTNFSYLHQFFNAKYIIGEPYLIDAHTISAEAIYFLSQTKSLRFEAQHQWASEYLKNWVGASLEFVANENFSFFANDIYNYGNPIAEQKTHYYNLGATFVKGATRFSVSYGRQRGGVQCVGGICRVVPESAGISMSLTTNF